MAGRAVKKYEKESLLGFGPPYCGFRYLSDHISGHGPERIQVSLRNAVRRPEGACQHFSLHMYRQHPGPYLSRQSGIFPNFRLLSFIFVLIALLPAVVLSLLLLRITPAWVSFLYPYIAYIDYFPYVYILTGFAASLFFVLHDR